jgi:predicted esterase
MLPAGVTEIVMAVSDTNLSEFQRRYPRVRDTGLGLTITPPGGGQRLPYSIIVFPDPPREGNFKDFSTAGIVLLRLEGADAAAPAPPPAEGVRNVLEQDQEFVAQEWPGSPGERLVKMWVQEPPAGINAGTGLMLVLHNWGGVYNSGEYVQWCRTFAERFNVVAVSVNYLQSGPDWKTDGPYDHGYLQAMDAIGALYTVRTQLAAAGVAFNDNRIYAMGGSGGGNVTEMAMKLAPHSFACGVDICGMPGLIDAIAFGTGEGTAINAGYSRDPNAPDYLSPDMQRIRDFGDLEHCRLLARANPNLRIVIVHGVDDRSCPVVPKIRQCANMIETGLNVDGHFLTDRDVDGAVITTTGHPVGNREQVFIKFADDYMIEDGDLPCATAGPSDFERGGTFEYPTDNGKFVIDFSGYPTIRFEAN